MGVVGVLHAATLSIHAIGRGSGGRGRAQSKHATKQLDPLLSNGRSHIERLFGSWVKVVTGARNDLVVALDWTECDADGSLPPAHPRLPSMFGPRS